MQCEWDGDKNADDPFHTAILFLLLSSEQSGGRGISREFVRAIDILNNPTFCTVNHRFLLVLLAS
mgnify:CR=1 FL=1